VPVVLRPSFSYAAWRVTNAASSQYRRVRSTP
jgi:hypothetical protein